MGSTLLTLFILQIFFPFCHPSPLDPLITARPEIGVAYGIELLPRATSCTWQCAVCAMYAPCSTCVTLSTPPGIECCTSKLENQSLCPTKIPLPPESTFYVYVIQSLTFFGRPTSLHIGTETLTKGGPSIIVSGHTLSIPTKGTGVLVDDGTSTSLGSPVQTVIGTGTQKTTVEGTTTAGGKENSIHHFPQFRRAPKLL